MPQCLRGEVLIAPVTYSVCVCVCVCVCEYMCVCVYIYVCVCMYVYIYIYIYIVFSIYFPQITTLLGSKPDTSNAALQDILQNATTCFIL